MNDWLPVMFFLMGATVAGALGYFAFNRWRRDTACQRERLADLAVREAEVMVRERQASVELLLEKRRNELEAGWAARELELVSVGEPETPAKAASRSGKRTLRGG